MVDWLDQCAKHKPAPPRASTAAGVSFLWETDPPPFSGQPTAESWGLIDGITCKVVNMSTRGTASHTPTHHQWQGPSSHNGCFLPTPYGILHRLRHSHAILLGPQIHQIHQSKAQPCHRRSMRPYTAGSRSRATAEAWSSSTDSKNWMHHSAGTTT